MTLRQQPFSEVNFELLRSMQSNSLNSFDSKSGPIFLKDP